MGLLWEDDPFVFCLEGDAACCFDFVGSGVASSNPIATRLAIGGCACCCYCCDNDFLDLVVAVVERRKLFSCEEAMVTAMDGGTSNRRWPYCYCYYLRFRLFSNWRVAMLPQHRIFLWVEKKAWLVFEDAIGVVVSVVDVDAKLETTNKRRGTRLWKSLYSCLPTLLSLSSSSWERRWLRLPLLLYCTTTSVVVFD